jgi:hypothetical protein
LIPKNIVNGDSREVLFERRVHEVFVPRFKIAVAASIALKSRVRIEPSRASQFFCADYLRVISSI